MHESTKTKLQQIQLRKLECQRHMRILTQKLANNPRDVWTRRELARLEELLADLEEKEKRLLSGMRKNTVTGGDKNVNPEGENFGGG